MTRSLNDEEEHPKNIRDWADLSGTRRRAGVGAIADLNPANRPRGAVGDVLSQIAGNFREALARGHS
jgi:hypothetical protein